jgi:hypothetical protein
MLYDGAKRSLIAQADWIKGYYKSLVGCKVVGVKARYDEYDNSFWTVLVLEDKDKNTFDCELSQDPEGNGPGFMFGLPEFFHEEEYFDMIKNLEGDDLDRMFHTKVKDGE